MNNHEVWAECPICGNEFDKRNGNECPDCNGVSVKELETGGPFHPTNKDNQ